MRNLVLCGGYRIHMLREFAKEYEHIYMFEPNGRMVFMDSPEQVTWIEAAVWTEYGTQRFYVDDKGYSSSLLEHKKTRGTLKEWQDSFVVPTVDIADWMLDKTECDMRMDIEGAEYEVLRHMIRHPDCLKPIKSMMIEWHGKRIGMTAASAEYEKEQLIERLESYDIIVSEER